MSSAVFELEDYFEVFSFDHHVSLDGVKVV